MMEYASHQESWGITMILLVDDSDLVLRVTKMHLEQHGYKVLACSSAQKATKEFLRYKHGISTVIADYRMHGIDGITFLQYIQQHQPSVKTILYSASLPRSIPEGIDTLAKPLEFSTLVQIIEKMPLLKSN